jgi:ATP-dependent RNA helicase DDX18/HAS1
MVVHVSAVDWIIQFDPPDDPKEYIHRVGRTARGKEGRGRALLLLMPEELGFLKYLKQAKVRLTGPCNLLEDSNVTLLLSLL